MKKLVFYSIKTSIYVLSLIACDRIDKVDQTLNEHHIKHIIDSLDANRFLGCYSEDNALTVFERYINQGRGARRLVFRIGYTVFIDSLQLKNDHTYHSAKLNTTYLIKDTSIIAIQYAKIIHPSSNWQGQTPWAQPYVTTHKRLTK